MRLVGHEIGRIQVDSSDLGGTWPPNPGIYARYGRQLQNGDGGIQGTQGILTQVISDSTPCVNEIAASANLVDANPNGMRTGT